MFFIVPLFLLLMSGTRAQQGSSSMGTHFVAAFPKTSLIFRSVSIYVTTYEMKAILTIKKPDKVASKSPTWKEETFTLDRYEQFAYNLTIQDCLDSNKVYNALVLKSNVAIKAFVRWVDYEKKPDHSFGNADIYDLVPKDICHTSYYTATTIGSPFIMILTFDEAASIHVAFPNLKKRFSLACAGDKPCAPGKNVSFSMEKYKAWYFVVRDNPNTKYDLHNTYITSDKPIFVISGNLLCQWQGQTSLIQDMCISSPKPMHTWGKEYVAPFFMNEEVTIHLRFNSATYPFESKINFLKTSRELRVNDEFYFIEFKVKAPFVVSSSTACAVTYYYCLYEHQGAGKYFSFSAQSLFPTEQWTQGSGRVIVLKNYYTKPNLIFVVSTARKIIRGIGMKEDIKTTPLRANKQTYYYGWSHEKGKFAVKVEGTERLMVYIMHIPYWFTAALRNLDYFQGVINDPTCKKTKPVPSDGVDNDCDGKLDEEAENGKDDDGDGLVDEDTIRSTVKESTWSPWETCQLKCDGKDITLKYRSCEVGMYTGSCKGENQKCDPGPACPTKCVSKAQKCNCLGNCATCNTTAGVCTECKPGYKSSDYCLEPCPKGWSGVACNTTESEVEEKNKVDETTGSEVEEETESKSFPWALLILPLAALLLLLCCLCIFLKRRKRENSKVDADQPEEDGEEKADEEGKQDDQQDNDDQQNDNGEDNQGGERGSHRKSGKEDQHPDGNEHDDGVEDENGDRDAAADNDDV